MRFVVSLFSSEKSHVSVTGSWHVSAEHADQAIRLTRFVADPRYWPPGSVWLCVTVEEGPPRWEAGIWNPA